MQRKISREVFKTMPIITPLKVQLSIIQD